MTIEDIDNELANPKYPRTFGKWYDENKLFGRLDEINEFYHCINFSSSNFSDHNYTGRLGNTHSSIYEGIKGTIESIKLLFQNGRINDGFTLIRKYSDAIVIDTYAAVVLKDVEANINLETNWCTLSDNIVNKWIKSQSSILSRNPGKELKKILETFPKISEILKLHPKNQNSLYERIRDLCNDNVHYNGFKNFLYNDIDFNNYNRENTIILLNNAYVCITFLVSLHFAFIYELHPEYFSSTDYCDYLDMGEQPPADSQYWVAPIFNAFFSNVVYKYNSKLGDYILSLQLMQLSNDTEQTK